MCLSPKSSIFAYLIDILNQQDHAIADDAEWEGMHAYAGAEKL